MSNLYFQRTIKPMSRLLCDSHHAGKESLLLSGQREKEKMMEYNLSCTSPKEGR